MADLASFQKNFRQAVQKGDIGNELTDMIVQDNLSAASRMQVYQNNYRMTLVALLEGIFPLTIAFVGEEFFRAVAKVFLMENPPSDPRLDQFGEKFPEFLAAESNVADIVYVADVAALEWAVHALQHVKALEEGAAMLPTARHGYFLNPNVRVIKSAYPLLQLWMVGMGQLMPEAVHIDAGAQNVAVLLDKFEVKLQPLTEAELHMLDNLNDILAADFDDRAAALKTLVTKNIVITI